jgi:histidinol phosphatase-like PHP family hydrolase
MAGGDERRRIDWHNHTRDWSDGALSVAEVAARGAALGLRIGIADHAISDNRRLRGEDQLLAYIADLERYPVLRGIEISLGEPRPPDDRWLARLTHVIASLHAVPVGAHTVHTTHYLNYRAGVLPALAPPPPVDSVAYLAALPPLLEGTFRRWPVTILGHFALRPDLAERAGPERTGECLDAVADLCVRYGVAIEINGKSRVPEPETVRHFAGRGVTFSFGSDGHPPEGVGDLAYPQALWAELGLPDDRLLAAPEG